MISRIAFFMSLLVGTAVLVLAQPDRMTSAPSIEKVAVVSLPGRPTVLVIRPAVDDKEPLCAERRNGFVACRTAGEFRQWVYGK